MKILPLGKYMGPIIFNSMYMMHTVLITVGDYFMFHLVNSLCGKECAVLSLVFNLTNEYVIRYISRTSNNGVEGSMAIAALYFFHLLPKKVPIWNKNLSWMTCFITVSFLSRSSSLAAWIPLALLKMTEHHLNFFAFVVAGLTVAVPITALSIILDSYYYGVWTIP